MSPLRTRPRLHALGRLLGAMSSPRRLLAFAILAAGLAGIELAGRSSDTDLVDLLLSLGLGLLWPAVAAVGGIHRVRLKARVNGAVGTITGRIAAAWPEVGIDFRDDPTVLRSTPPVVVWANVLLVVTVLAVIAWNLLWGGQLRSFLAPHIYLVWLSLFVGLAIGLLFLTAFGVFLTWLSIRHVLWMRGAPRSRARSLALAWLLPLTALVLWVPVEIALLLGVSALVAVVVRMAVLRAPRLTLLWRRRSDGQVGSTSWTMTTWQWTVMPMGALLVFIALGLGGAWTWWPGASGTTPLIDAASRAAAWAVGTGFVAMAAVQVHNLSQLVRADPSVPCPTSVHVVPETTKDDLPRARELLEARGWVLRGPPEEPAVTDVLLRLVDSPMPRPPSGWPLLVSARALEVPELLELIARRDVVQRRRIFRRRLKALIGGVRRREFEKGGGFWIAPHLWYVGGVTRDTEEDDLSEDGLHHEIGPPYARLFPLPVRHHVYEVLRAAYVDIILLEDGVAWPAFRRVLDRIFAHFDARRGRIEERDFKGIHGVRVILHELEPGGQLEAKGYPEPDYSELARGRILHVFKDRGGPEDELEPVPSEDTWIPVGV